ncbi:MAG TPA: ParB/RepB/Spo0J family partition protein [Polyangiales bacterium]|jgi:ParB family chromosome partitioning protein|nr:ParB/RepB/Spo0J family partition protein [Polyangiales bacterium]
MNDINKRRLGRGLDALLPSAPPPAAPKSQPQIAAAAADGFKAKIEELHPNRSQPRTRFDDAALDELANSIKSIGILEPILVRRRAAGGFEIIAGERRWRAAQRAGLHDVPVYVRELTEQRVFEAALVENLQREDLNPLETARAFQRLMDEHSHTHETIAQLIGKDRSTVANALRLLKLPEVVIDLIESKELSEGHGRALLSAGDTPTMLKLAREAIAGGWSVREVERKARVAAQAKQEAEEPVVKSANTRDLEERLTRRVGARVTVADRKGKGHLQITFTSYDELDRLITLLEKPV